MKKIILLFAIVFLTGCYDYSIEITEKNELVYTVRFDGKDGSQFFKTLDCSMRMKSAGSKFKITLDTPEKFQVKVNLFDLPDLTKCKSHVFQHGYGFLSLEANLEGHGDNENENEKLKSITNNSNDVNIYVVSKNDTLSKLSSKGKYIKRHDDKYFFVDYANTSVNTIRDTVTKISERYTANKQESVANKAYFQDLKRKITNNQNKGLNGHELGLALGAVAVVGGVKWLLNDNNSESYSSSPSSSSNYEVCNGGENELCFEVLKEGYSKGTYIIKCTKGSHVGYESKVCVDRDGDWSYSTCSLGSYHYNSRRKAGNKACGW